MKGLVLCNKGIEDAAALDIKEIINRDAAIFNGFAIFDFEKKEELCKLAYLSQSIKKVILVLSSFEFKSEEGITQKAGKLNLKEWLKKGKTFSVEALIDKPQIDSEIEGEIGKAVIDSIKDYKQKVDLEEPDIVLFVFVRGNKAFFGIDFSGKDLSKREYRIFSSPKNIKATLAYAAVRFSGYKRGEVLVDPFCLSGSIVIETTLFENNFSIHFYKKDDFLFTKFMEFDFESIDKKAAKDKGNIYAFDAQFRNIDAAKKNAKIAGINKAINYSRLEVGWLDTKFDKESVDRIVTCLPNITKFCNKKDLLKLYQEFFYQAEFVLKKKGRIIVCTKNPDEIKDCGLAKNFKVEEEREVWQGKEGMSLVRFCK